MTETTVDFEAAIRTCVRAFYERACADDLLAPIFNGMVKNWDAHFAIMDDFWSGALLGTDEAAIPAATIAQACETIVMATIPGTMRRDQFEAAVTTLGAAASRMVGLVLDDAGNPTVGEELCRLAGRLERYLPAVSRKLTRWLSQRPLLWDRA